ncbi:hypothetical protein ANCDUO_16587, partial [Ancylostoma duodenale]
LNIASSISRSAWYFCVLVLTKILRCIGIFFIDILAKGIHVVSLLWLVKVFASFLLLPIQKPLSQVYTYWKIIVSKFADRSVMVLWYYILWTIEGSSTTTKSRGVFFLVIGFVALMLMDRDQTIEHSHDKTHSHHSGLNHVFYHFISMFGVSDHQGGIVILFLALLLRIGYDSSFRHLAVEIGGPKRLYSLVSTCSAMLLTPVGVLAMTMTTHVADPVMAAARWSPVTMFSCALGLAWMWYSGQGVAEHAVTSGVLITVVAFMLASVSLTSSSGPKHRGGELIGMSDTGLPLFTYKEAFLQKTSRSLLLFVQETLREILANSDSRRIFWFLCVNLAFCGVEFLYGFWTNSLGLISDGFHMLFDCSALVLSGFINALFLCVIALFILIEALERLFDPPNINTDRLLFVAVSGLLVNLFGMYSFHGGGDHGHGHSHGGGSHGHSHGNANMQGYP